MWCKSVHWVINVCSRRYYCSAVAWHINRLDLSFMEIWHSSRGCAFYELVTKPCDHSAEVKTNNYQHLRDAFSHGSGSSHTDITMHSVCIYRLFVGKALPVISYELCNELLSCLPTACFKLVWRKALDICWKMPWIHFGKRVATWNSAGAKKARNLFLLSSTHAAASGAGTTWCISSQQPSIILIE